MGDLKHAHKSYAKEPGASDQDFFRTHARAALSRLLDGVARRRAGGGVDDHRRRPDESRTTSARAPIRQTAEGLMDHASGFSVTSV